MRAFCWGSPGARSATVPTQREDEDRLTQAMVTLASQYGGYGYRRITAMLVRAGRKVGKDRVARI
jgi:putative transposase